MEVFDRAFGSDLEEGLHDGESCNVNTCPEAGGSGKCKEGYGFVRL